MFAGKTQAGDTAQEKLDEPGSNEGKRKTEPIRQPVKR